MTFEGVPGLVETIEAHGETTLVVDPARLVEACLHLRDGLGFRFLSDISAADYLGWGGRTAGYIGTPAGRDINSPGSWGLGRKPKEKPCGSWPLTLPGIVPWPKLQEEKSLLSTFAHSPMNEVRRVKS